MVPPINMLFSFLKDQTPVQVWLYEQVDSRLEGTVRVSSSPGIDALTDK
jgi:small nuclear ribonucleoprotein E